MWVKPQFANAFQLTRHHRWGLNKLVGTSGNLRGTTLHQRQVKMLRDCSPLVFVFSYFRPISAAPLHW